MSAPFALDRSLERFVIAHRTATMATFAKFVSHVGDPAVLVVAALVIAVALASTPRRRSLMPAIALVVGSVFARAGKVLVGRPRPPLALRLVRESGPSFPSGHTTGTTALFVAAALIAWPVVPRRGKFAVAATALALSIGVGVSRLVLGVHWGSDVIAGWIVGGAVAWLVVASRRFLPSWSWLPG